MMVIPKATRPEHVRENLGALDLKLTGDDLATLDSRLPAAQGPQQSGDALAIPPALPGESRIHFSR